MSRRLAAILVADVVGYSRLMEADEAGTHAALKERRTAHRPTGRGGARRPDRQVHGRRRIGRICERSECGLLCSRFAARDGGGERTLPDERRMFYRIGINLGDVIGEGSDIYGEGVNIAARLESMAGPGGICISGIVHESLGNRIEANFVDSGQHAVKNITRPIRVWRWSATRSRADRPAWRGAASRCLISRRLLFCRSTTCPAIQSRNTSRTA